MDLRFFPAFPLRSGVTGPSFQTEMLPYFHIIRDSLFPGDITHNFAVSYVIALSLGCLRFDAARN